nr:hypothetical protein [uncultured Pseudomonas sp.]
MSEIHFTQREAEEQFESTDSDDELRSYLEELAPQIGWIVIFFNSLEDGIAQCIRDVMLHDPYQDERMDVFLSEMMFTAKCRSLMHLYGQIIESAEVKLMHTDLNKLEKMLLECSKRRNEYAHADWIGLKKGAYVRVKAQSKKRGITQRYKRFEPEQVESDIAFINLARHTLNEFNERIIGQLWSRE